MSQKILSRIISLGGKSIATKIESGDLILKQSHKDKILSCTDEELSFALLNLKLGRAKTFQTAYIAGGRRQKELSELNENHIQFIELFADGMPSVDAWKISFNHLAKVYASNILMDLKPWELILEIWTQNANTPYKETLKKAKDDFENKHNANVFDVYREHALKLQAGNPIKEILILKDLFEWFILLRRNKFALACKEVLQYQYNKLIEMANDPVTGPLWKPQLQKLPPIKPILNHEIYVRQKIEKKVNQELNKSVSDTRKALQDK